jgi:ABC-type spermidine/putrescine transport system permease subunit II
MLTAHRIVAFLVLVSAFAAAALAGLAYRRRRTPGAVTTHLLTLVQTLLVAQVALGLLLLSQHHRAPQRLHYLYGTLALLAVLSPWVYAPAGPRRRLAWFAGATLIAGALAVRAYMTGTG